jgi:threonylcarbamoyladenosine tRNA methylthiotransferase MtaB
VRSYYVENFGCRANQADGAAIERQFRERGLDRACSREQASLIVLNTCTVTAAADQDARAAVRRIHRINPDCQIIITGCYAQRAPAEIAAQPGVHQVVGNSHKHQLAEIALNHDLSSLTRPSHPELAVSRPPSTGSGFVPLSNLTGQVQPFTSDIYVSDVFAHTELIAAPVFDAANGRTRPNLKIQDGCGNRCSFCVIPYVRGNSRSRSLPRVLCEVNALIDGGFKEIVISGINLGRWGHDLADKQSFAMLIRAILDHTSLEKLRISSVEPMDWSDELITLMACSPRIAKHAHVPMQSGSDAVLRRMRRKYRPWHYRDKIERIRAAIPSAAIGADVMVGFPGESAAEFEDTRQLIEDLPFTYLHVFTYSARPGTAAADMRKQVPTPISHQRNRILRDLARRKKAAFMLSFIGKEVEAITLNRSEVETVDCESESLGKPAGLSGVFTEALTDNYLKLRLMGQHPPNRWTKTRITQVENGGLIGTAL